MLLLLVKPHWLYFLRTTPLDIFPCSCRVGGRAKRWSGPAGSVHSAAQSLVTGWMNSARSDLMSIPCSVCVCVCVRVCAAANTTWHCNLQDELTHACMISVSVPVCACPSLSQHAFQLLFDVSSLTWRSPLKSVSSSGLATGGRPRWRVDEWLRQRCFTGPLKPSPGDRSLSPPSPFTLSLSCPQWRCSAPSAPSSHASPWLIPPA